MRYNAWCSNWEDLESHSPNLAKSYALLHTGVGPRTRTCALVMCTLRTAKVASELFQRIERSQIPLSAVLAQISLR